MAVARGPGRSIGNDPYASFRFQAEIDQLVVSGFNEVTGLTFESELQTFREGGVNMHERQLPGPTKFPAKLILKRGLADADALWSWYRGVMEGRIERKQVTVVLQNHAGEKTWQWVFREDCPVKWNGLEFRAGTAEVAFESIELVHHGLEVGAPNGRLR